MGETHEIPHHNLADFEPCLGYATKGQAVGGVPLPNTLEGPQFRPQPHPLHVVVGRVLPVMVEREKLDHIKERLRAIEGDTLPVFYYEKMVGYTPSSFADLVFASERIEVGLKRGKFNHPALTNKKPGANREDEKEEGNHVVTIVPTWPNFPPAQQCQYSANIIPSHYPPPNQPQRPPLNHPMPNTTLNTNQKTNRGRNFPTKKPVEFTPILVSYANLLPYLLNNAMVAITPTKVPQPLFFQGYNSNTTCAYHGGVPGHFIEHCITLKHKVQGLINVGWLKFEEDNRL
ncbi:hypothetical protein GmHk_12G035187 [Glycine max]|nr:hypothetical protein GmHk_12G035187 [Glycine max]